MSGKLLYVLYSVEIQQTAISVHV